MIDEKELIRELDDGIKVESPQAIEFLSQKLRVGIKGMKFHF